MAHNNPLGFMQNGGMIPSGGAHNVATSNQVDLTPEAWIREGIAVVDNGTNAISNSMPALDASNELVDYMGLNRMVYEAVQNLDFAEESPEWLYSEDSGHFHAGHDNHHKKVNREHLSDEEAYKLLDNPSSIVRKMGDTIGFTCYKRSVRQLDLLAELKDHYKQRRSSKHAKKQQQPQKHQKQRKNKLSDLAYSKGATNQQFQKSAKIVKPHHFSDTTTSSDDNVFLQKKEKNNKAHQKQQQKHYGNNNKQAKDYNDSDLSGLSSIADFTVNDEELNHFANTRLSDLKKELGVSGYDSDSSTDSTTDYEGLAKNAQRLLAQVNGHGHNNNNHGGGRKGRGVSMHGIFQAAQQY